MKQSIRARLTLLGFVMSCLIVIYHVTLPTREIAVNCVDGALHELLQILIEDLGAVAMSFFFAATGYKLFSCPPGQTLLTSYPQKLRRRVSSLLIPYLLWRLLAAIRPMAAGELSFGELILRSFRLADFPVNGPIWYIYVVFLFALISPLLYLFLADRRVGLAAVLGTILLTAFLRSTQIPALRAFADYGRVANTIRYTPSYVLGAFFGVHCSREPDYKDLQYVLMAVIFSFVINDYFPRACFDTVITITPLFLLYCFPIRGEPSPTGPVRLGFLVYVIHDILLGSLRWRVEVLVPRSPLGAFLTDILGRAFCFGCCLLAASLLHRILSRFAPKVLSVLTGGRD